MWRPQALNLNLSPKMKSRHDFLMAGMNYEHVEDFPESEAKMTGPGKSFQGQFGVGP